jgi:hypothetical protein
VEYRIARHDVIEFLRLMAERRRMRRRDGARHWHLLRDLSDGEVWIERFDTPTWLDYVRQAQRITQADAPVLERLRTLHRGSEPPRVRRMMERETGSIPPELSPEDLQEPITEAHQHP